MGLMADLVKAITPGEGTGASLQDRLVQCVLEKFQGSSGSGLAGLLEQFRDKGLGDAVQSWIGKGPNQSITPEQVESAMGSDSIRQLASQCGLSPDVIAARLSESLPKIVDELTPDGKLPEEASVS